MRLVGVSLYIQMPFIMEAAFAGLLGGAVACVLLLVGRYFLIDHGIALAEKMQLVNFIGWDAVLAKLPLVIAIGLLMPAVAAFIALRKSLKRYPLLERCGLQARADPGGLRPAGSAWLRGAVALRRRPSLHGPAPGHDPLVAGEPLGRCLAVFGMGEIVVVARGGRRLAYTPVDADDPAGRRQRLRLGGDTFPRAK
ncbi:hypothetical protein STANM309S_02192 [Streptomyces tanashiensis]